MRCGKKRKSSNDGGTPMKITSVEVGRAIAAGREKRVVTVRVQRKSRPQETMRITVVVPEDSDERLAREFGLARAKDFARRFIDL
jgi:hypothetical protein